MRDNNNLSNNDVVEFDVHCKMKKCWADEFLSFLKKMQEFGNVGHSELLGFYADGDGDFRPKFKTEFKYNVTKAIEAKHLKPTITMFDAG